MDEPELMDRTAFQRRFKFLKGSIGDNERLDDLANYDEFRREMGELEGKSVRSRVFFFFSSIDIFEQGEGR